jgi:hypothetical protein
VDFTREVAQHVDTDTAAAVTTEHLSGDLEENALVDWFTHT